MKPNVVIGILLICVGGFLYYGKQAPKPTPKPSLPEPTADLKTLVAPLSQWKGKPGAQDVANFYRDFADILARDPKSRTTGWFRSGHQEAQALFAQKTDLAGKLPGISAAIDSVLMQTLGKEDGPLDKQKAINALNAIAWALTG